jgi:hypothetical protein
MVAPESYRTPQPPESANSPVGQVATTDPSPAPDSMTWLTTWWTEAGACVPGVGVGVGEGVCRVPPPPDEPCVDVPLAAMVSVGGVVPAVAACPVCAWLPGVAPRALLERTSTSTLSKATTRTLETMATPVSTSRERARRESGELLLGGWSGWAEWSGHCGG